MTGLVGWALSRARMILAFVVLSVGAGLAAYTGLPKEGAPNIDIPILFVSADLPGVSATDAERLLLKPLETELRGLEGLKEMTSYAREGGGGVVLEFDFGWDKAATVAETRDKVDRAQAEMPEEAEEPSVSEINLSEFSDPDRLDFGRGAGAHADASGEGPATRNRSLSASARR